MIAALEDEPGITRLRRAIYVVFAAGLLAFVARGADRPADPAFRAAPTTPPTLTPGLDCGPPVCPAP